MLRDLGPWVISAATMLTLLVLLLWTVLRLVDRPMIRYFEPGRARRRR